MAARRASQHAFTIVEMLVVISVIAALIALLLPAINRARAAAKKTEEASNLRQVGTAWMVYANNNNEAVLPGFLHPDVQSDTYDGAWDIAYRFPDKSLISPEDAEEWPWRLLGYLNYSHNIVHGYLNEADTSPLAMIDHAGEVAEQPAFGYNAYYIGGWYPEHTEWQQFDHPMHRFYKVAPLDESGQPAIVHPTEDGEITVQVNVVVRSPSSITETDRLILFCGATVAQPGVRGRIDDSHPGSHYVVPPYLADQPQWQRTGGGIEVLADDTAIPAARYTAQVGALHADLHWAPHSPGELQDMRYWINNVVQWTPQKEGEPSTYDFFMHSPKPLY